MKILSQMWNVVLGNIDFSRREIHYIAELAHSKVEKYLLELNQPGSQQLLDPANFLPRFYQYLFKKFEEIYEKPVGGFLGRKELW